MKLSKDGTGGTETHPTQSEATVCPDSSLFQACNSSWDQPVTRVFLEYWVSVTRWRSSERVEPLIVFSTTGNSSNEAL